MLQRVVCSRCQGTMVAQSVRGDESLDNNFTDLCIYGGLVVFSFVTCFGGLIALPVCIGLWIYRWNQRIRVWHCTQCGNRIPNVT